MLYRREIATCAILALALLSPALASDGRIEINQAKALAGGVTPGDTAGFPVTISLPGSYILTSDLDVTVAPDPPNTTAILVTSSQKGITIDLNGFAIRGPAVCPLVNPCTGTGLGVGVNALFTGTLVRNGSVVGMGAGGIEAERIESVQALSNGGVGITGLLIEGSRSELNGSHGFSSSGTVSGCSAIDNHGYGYALQFANGFHLSSLFNVLGGVVMSSSRVSDSVIDLLLTCNGGCFVSESIFVNCSGASCIDGTAPIYQPTSSPNLCGNVPCP